MRKPAFCICENKDAHHCAADQHLCFHYIDSSISLIVQVKYIFKDYLAMIFTYFSILKLNCGAE